MLKRVYHFKIFLVDDAKILPTCSENSLNVSNSTAQMIFAFGIIFFIVVLGGGIHCSIYKGSYNVSNISYLNLLPLLCLSSLSPDSRNSFNRYHS
jgi:hypothetical protein